MPTGNLGDSAQNLLGPPLLSSEVPQGGDWAWLVHWGLPETENPRLEPMSWVQTLRLRCVGGMKSLCVEGEHSGRLCSLRHQNQELVFIRILLWGGVTVNVLSSPLTFYFNGKPDDSCALAYILM